MLDGRTAPASEPTLTFCESFTRANLKKGEGGEENCVSTNTVQNSTTNLHFEIALFFSATLSRTSIGFVNISKCQRGEKNSTK